MNNKPIYQVPGVATHMFTTCHKNKEKQNIQNMKYTLYNYINFDMNFFRVL